MIQNVLVRVVWLTEFGPPDVLVPGDAPDPEPGEGEALVSVAVAGITYIETLVRAGRSPRPDDATLSLPTILGNGVGGTVAAVGAGVDPSLVGRRVVATTGGRGGYADRAAVNADDLILVPDALELSSAVALLADGRTAVGLTRLAPPQAGEWVLVEAAAGGVGSLLVQLARNAGAKVIAAASSEPKRDLARELGGGVTVDYTDPAWPDQVRSTTGGAGLDLVFDGVGGTIGRDAFRLTKPGGRFVIFGMAGGSFTDTNPAPGAPDPGIRLITLQQFATLGASLRDLATAALAEAAAGRLKPVIGQTFPLERAADAHAAIEARTALGKTLLLA
jgi:NADPH:quinone reductase